MTSHKFPPFDGMENFKGGMPPFPGGMPPKEPPLADVSHIENKYLDLAYGTASVNQKLDLYLPEKGEKPSPVILYIHGGGFAMGNKRDEHMLCLLQFRKLGWAVAAIEYRLSKEAIFPAAMYDVKSAVRYLKAHASEYHLDPERFAAMGGSAGGNLSAMLAVSENVTAFDDPACPLNSYSTKVAAAVDWFGPVDFKDMDEQAKANGFSFTDHNDAHSPESQYLGSPLGTCSKDLADSAGPFPYITKDMAPILIEHGSKDRFVPPEQSKKLFDTIVAKAGTDKAEFHVLAEADHGDPMFEEDYNMQTVRVFLSRVFDNEVNS